MVNGLVEDVGHGVTVGGADQVLGSADADFIACLRVVAGFGQDVGKSEAVAADVEVGEDIGHQVETVGAGGAAEGRGSVAKELG